MSLVGCRKRWGRKGALGRGWCILHLNLGNKQIGKTSYRTNTPHRSLTTRRPSYRYQVWQSLQFHRCRKSVLPTKFAMQYGFALVCPAARERSKKTEAVFLGAFRESEGKSKSPQAPLSLPYFLSRRSEKESMKRYSNKGSIHFSVTKQRHWRGRF